MFQSDNDIMEGAIDNLMEAAQSGDGSYFWGRVAEIIIPALRIAVENGHSDIMKRMCDNGKLLNFPFKLEAWCWNQQDVVKMMIEHGADIEEQKIDNESPLMQTCVHHPKVAKILVGAGADVHWDSNGETVLEKSC